MDLKFDRNMRVTGYLKTRIKADYEKMF